MFRHQCSATFGGGAGGAAEPLIEDMSVLQIRERLIGEQLSHEFVEHRRARLLHSNYDYSLRHSHLVRHCMQLRCRPRSTQPLGHL